MRRYVCTHCQKPQAYNWITTLLCVVVLMSELYRLHGYAGIDAAEGGCRV